MNFKSKPETGNIIAMIIIIVFLFTMSFIWLYMKYYIYFIILLIISFIITHIYFFSYYTLDKKHFVAHLGLLKIKYDYHKIKSIVEVGNKVKLQFNNYSFDIYPENKETFVKEIKKKIKVKK